MRGIVIVDECPEVLHRHVRAFLLVQGQRGDPGEAVIQPERREGDGPVQGRLREAEEFIVVLHVFEEIQRRAGGILAGEQGLPAEITVPGKADDLRGAGFFQIAGKLPFQHLEVVGEGFLPTFEEGFHAGAGDADPRDQAVITGGELFGSRLRGKGKGEQQGCDEGGISFHRRFIRMRFSLGYRLLQRGPRFLAGPRGWPSKQRVRSPFGASGRQSASPWR